MPTSWEWNNGTINAPLGPLGDGFQLQHSVPIPEGASLQRIITEGGMIPKDREGWEIIDGNPSWCAYQFDWSILVYESSSKITTLMRRLYITQPSIQGHNGISSVAANVTWQLPWDFFKFSTQVRLDSGPERQIQVNLRCSAVTARDDPNFTARDSANGQVTVRVLFAYA